jgi:hypothetical protein
MEPHSTATMVQGSIWTIDCCAIAMESGSVSLLLGDTDKGRRMKPHSTNGGLLDHCDGVRLGLFVGALLSDTKREAVETTHD